MSQHSQKTLSTTLTHLNVRFAETDQMGIAHHSSYVLWCEVARVDWMKAHGMNYRVFEEQTGISLAVSGLSINYRQAVSFDDALSIQTSLIEAKSRRFVFDYQLYCEEKLIAQAQTMHTPTNRAGQTLRIPTEWLAALAEYVEQV